MIKMQSHWDYRWNAPIADLTVTAAKYQEIAKDPKYPNYASKAKSVLEYMERLKADTEFPYYVVYDDDHYDMDVYEDIAWRAFGPSHGECTKEYTVGSHGRSCNEHYCCPDIEIHEDFYLEMWEGPNGNWWKERYPTYEEFLDRISEGPQTYDHSHLGVWKHKFIVKNGYDHGMTAFQFKSEDDLNDFIVKTSLGPQYEFIGGSNDPS